MRSPSTMSFPDVKADMAFNSPAMSFTKSLSAILMVVGRGCVPCGPVRLECPRQAFKDALHRQTAPITAPGLFCHGVKGVQHGTEGCWLRWHWEIPGPRQGCLSCPSFCVCLPGKARFSRLPQPFPVRSKWRPG